MLQLSPFYIYAQGAQECSLLAGERFNEIVGSSYYMAPEVLKCNYGLEVDVWSAGVIVFILLYGVLPFWASLSFYFQKNRYKLNFSCLHTETEQGVAQVIIHSIIDFKRDPWPKVLDNAKDLVKKCLILIQSSVLQYRKCLFLHLRQAEVSSYKIHEQMEIRFY
ncbi:hypothetical protein Godav_011184 [Gossypium davidsonii]|uniref:Protein kinase domain-containing protein n=1 Tax=Gossypium davidsonii TaxID=34287 RepID=A0A7J8R910_GOSDV|nr:hypothetical protein [Gossypium davidsonii]